MTINEGENGVKAVNEFPFNGNGSFQVSVVNHCFYKPTARYFNT